MDVTKHRNSILTDGESTLAVGRGVTGGGAQVSQVLPAAGQDRESVLRFCDKNLLKQSKSQCPREAPGIKELSRSRPVVMVTLLSLKFTLECPSSPVLRAWETLLPQLTAPAVLMLLLLCQAPPLTSQA
jgi:hypothetical protein